MYYDSSKEILIQIRDRLRDLLEADMQVKAAYPGKIWRLMNDNVSETEQFRVSLAILNETLSTAPGNRLYDRETRFFLTVQHFFDAQSAPDNGQVEEDAYDACVTLTNVMQKAVMRYQSDPSQLVEGQVNRLWDEMKWEERTTTNYDPAPYQWHSTSTFTLYTNLQPFE